MKDSPPKLKALFEFTWILKMKKTAIFTKKRKKSKAFLLEKTPKITKNTFWKSSFLSRVRWWYFFGTILKLVFKQYRFERKFSFSFIFVGFCQKRFEKALQPLENFERIHQNTSLISMLKGFEKRVKLIQNVFSPVGLICYESKLWSESYPPSVDGVVFNVLS